MGKVVVANPPLGIYKNPDITIGQAFYLVQLDVHSRARRDLLNQEVFFPAYAFNVFGRRGDLKDNPVQFAQEYRGRPSLREKLDLCSNETLSDDEDHLIKGVQGDFLKLFNAGFILSNPQGEFSLDVEKIKNRFQLSSILDGVVMNERTKYALERYWQENMDIPHLITRPTKFSVENPLGGQNIGPLFGLANLWDHKYPESEIILAGSERNLTNYIFLRMLTQTALRGRPGVSQIFVYPQLRFAEGMEAWNLERVLEDCESDILRYALSTCSDQGGSASIGFPKLIEGRGFVKKLENVARILNFLPDSGLVSDCAKKFILFEHSKALKSLYDHLFRISREITEYKKAGSLEKNRLMLSQEYSQIVRTAMVVTPKICKKIMGI